MGKADKKVKSDRINTLRKKYDAFLEEDKKRKERNDHILGRLDKMRYGTSAIRYKAIYTDSNLPAVYSRNEYQSDTCVRQLARPDQQLLPLDIIRRPADDTLLIKEMSKKYILIPKLRSTHTKNYIETTPTEIFQPNPQPESSVSDDVDWKSKYDILEQLNDKEKDEKTKANIGRDGNYCIPSILEKSNFNNDQKKKTENCGLTKYEDKTGESSIKYKNELYEKDLTGRKILVEYELQKSEKYEINKTPSATADDDYQGKPNVTSMDPTTVGISKYKYQNANIEYEKSPVEESIKSDGNVNWHPEAESCLNIEYTNTQNLEIDNTNVENEYSPKCEPTVYEENEPKKEDRDKPEDNEAVVYLDQDDVCPIQVINPSELVEEINTASFGEDAKDIENPEYPIEIINTQEFTPEDDLKLQDGVNINPDGHVMNSSENYLDSAYQQSPPSETVAETEHTEDPADTSGIEAFDAEQREMFYSEPVDENYGYVQEGADAYNPEYGQNDNYQQNDEYVYYEGTQAEQYPVDLNDHEETTQPYDQHYEQQYGNTYEQQEFQGHEQAVPPQQMEQIEQSVLNYQNQPEFDQQYEQLNEDTGVHVEQELDNEQGYIEKHNVEDTDREKQTVLDKQQTDQTVEQKTS